jgi:hypothetical protein
VAVAAIESAYAIKTGRLLDLSEQQLVSCVANGSYGCIGGSKAAAMEWVVKNKGICAESSYPYSSGITRVSGACNVVNKVRPVVHSTDRFVVL